MTNTRKVGPWEVQPVALGCMNLSHAYKPQPDAAHAERLLNEALDAGYDLIDTASLYGEGRNEELIARAIGHRRQEYVLASKCGIVIDPDGTRRMSGHPDDVAKTLDASLQRLGVDVIDLYYLHRRDPKVPIEDSIGALKRAVEAGKVRHIGVSEVSAETLRRAHAVHPITALQTEYSLWTRNAEIAVLDACAELGIAFLAFSPVARGFLSETITSPDQLQQGDIRVPMPRFQEPNFSHNRSLLPPFLAKARALGVTPGQLAIAWVLARAPHIVALPGTRSIEHMRDNLAAGAIVLDEATVAEIDGMINRSNVAGARYPAAVQASIDTEEFADA